MIVGAQVPEINTEPVVHVYRHEGKYLNAHRPTIRAWAPCVCRALIPAAIPQALLMALILQNRRCGLKAESAMIGIDADNVQAAL